MTLECLTACIYTLIYQIKIEKLSKLMNHKALSSFFWHEIRYKETLINLSLKDFCNFGSAENDSGQIDAECIQTHKTYCNKW